MQAVQTRELELMRFTQPADPGNAVDAAWPVYRDTGSVASAVVYVELQPGMHLATHTDSAEEVLVILDGEIEAIVGDERARVGRGGVVVVPAMVPHGAVNVGEGVARFAGVFGSNTIVSQFDHAFEQTGGSVVGTPPPAPAQAPAGAAA